MHVLIAGGSGFIGQALCKELQNNRIQTAILTRNKNRAAGFFSSQDVSIYTYEDDIPPCEVVINLAGESISARLLSNRRREEILRSRLNVISHLKDKLAASPPELFIQASATGIYTKGQNCDECGALDNNLYSSICCSVEKSAGSAFSKTAIARIGVVLGQGGGLYRITRRLPPFRIIGGNNHLPWISLEDCARAFVFLTIHRLNGIFNFTSPNLLTCNQILAKCPSLLKMPVIPIPKLALTVDRRADLLLYDGIITPHNLQSSGFVFNS